MSGKSRNIIEKSLVFYTGNETDSALKYFKKAHEIEVHPTIAYHIGTLLATRKADYRSALKYFNIAIKMDTTFALAYWNRGMCEMSLGDRGEMRRNFEKYFKLSPNDPGNKVLRDMIEKAFSPGNNSPK